MDEDELSQLLSRYEQDESSVRSSQTNTAVSDFHYIVMEVCCVVYNTVYMIVFFLIFMNMNHFSGS